MELILIILGLGIVIVALVVLFMLGAARVSARGAQRAYVQGILHNVEIRGRFDNEERNL